MVAGKDSNAYICCLTTAAVDAVQDEISRSFENLRVSAVNVERVAGPGSAIEVIVRVEEITEAEEDDLGATRYTGDEVINAAIKHALSNA